MDKNEQAEDFRQAMNDIEDVSDLKSQKLQEYDEIYDQIINARKNTDRVITIRISGFKDPVKVYKNILLDAQKKLHECKKSILEQGSDFIAETVYEEKQIEYIFLSSLCVDKPYNDPDFWIGLDMASNGDTANILEEIISGIKKMKKR